MHKELCEQLYTKFPDIFQKKISIDCGDGWYGILEGACYQIQDHIRNAKSQIEWTEKYNAKLFDIEDEPRPVPELPEQFVALQIKEKFGTLRFYGAGISDFINGVIYMAESMSGRMCETCGKPARSSVDGSWYSTRCDEHKRF